MSKKAFPSNSMDKAFGDNGMDLRDWFAGQYLTSIDSDALQSFGKVIEETGMELPVVMAKFAYEIADAMMRQRKSINYSEN